MVLWGQVLYLSASAGDQHAWRDQSKLQMWVCWISFSLLTDVGVHPKGHPLLALASAVLQSLHLVVCNSHSCLHLRW